LTLKNEHAAVQPFNIENITRLTWIGTTALGNSTHAFHHDGPEFFSEIVLQHELMNCMILAPLTTM
jgi:hypothetical protein